MNGINGINSRTLLVNRDNELAAMLQIGGCYALVQNDPDLVVMAAGQGIRVIYRESGDAPEDEPLRQDPAAFVQKRAEHAPAAYFIHCLNEIDPSIEEQRWNREAFRYAKSIGRRLLVGNYSTHRSREQWEFARPLLAETVGAWHAIGFHHYVPPGNAAGGLEWLATKLGVGGLWLCSEFAFGRYTADGRIDPHRGWRGVTDAAARRAFVEKWSMYYSAKNIALLWYCYDFWDKPNLEVAKAEGFGYNDLPDALDSFATFNQLYTVKDMPTMPDYTTHDWGALVPKATVSVTQEINRRDKPTEEPGGKPTGVVVGKLNNGDVASYYDKPFQNTEYLWYKIVFAGVECYAAKVSGLTFTPYVEPPPPPVEPPAEETVEFKLAEVETLIADAERIVAILKGAKLPADGTKMLLDVPFVSQRGSDADVSNNDCGISSLLMLTRYAMKQRGFLVPDAPTVDDLIYLTPLRGNPSALMQFKDIIPLAKHLGFKAESKQGMTTDAIRASLNLGAPVMALVDYSVYYLGGAKIPHLLVVTGYDGDEFVTNDPYLLGANVRVTAAKLDAAMKTVPGNSGSGQCLVLAA